MGQWSVEVSCDDDAVSPALLARLEGAALLTLEAEAARECLLSVALVGDGEICRLNREYLGHDRPTDVIAFPLEQLGAPLVGDVYVGLDQARRQAAELGLMLEEELLRLTIHGTLHVLGWDHPDDEMDRETSPMYARQEALLGRLRPT